MANGGRFEEEGPDSVVELRAGKENSIIDGRQSDCHVESKDNCLIKASVDRLGKEHTTGFSESRPDGVPIGEHAMPEQVREEAFGNNEGSKAAFKHRKRINQLKESLCKDPDQKDVETKTNVEELIPSPLNSAVAKDDATLEDTAKEKKTSLILHSSLERICTNFPKKKLLVLDLNGILVDVVPNPGEFRPDIKLSGKGVFKRPFCNDFLEFCLRTFNVGIWSSRINKNVRILVDFLLRKRKKNLLFCWDRSRCTITKLETLEDKPKPLVLKELRKLWKNVSKLPWEKGEYDESNTLLLDDSPYKALRNPANTAIFPFPYQYTDAEDASLGPGGDIRTYLEGVAAAEDVQKYVEQNPFGQPAITESNPHWDFYRQIIDRK
ncbi:NLI interacting factor [Corchorus capsularis]|uniref:Mitochondrial import inner membrane translocase subunit TIM50 n=1 Tax=Corchorus capsularis TaxID=210143 RepID=A0A1R3GY66_COCAP|nr:NLI interacting factor [Corchorus capsularis]